MISIKDYAKSKMVSYEAIRKQITRYKEELEGHIIKVGRTQYLDDEAISFLDSKRAENPIIIFERNKDETIENLKNENHSLLLKIAELQNQLLTEKDNNRQLQEEKIKFLESCTVNDKEKEILKEHNRELQRQINMSISPESLYTLEQENERLKYELEQAKSKKKGWKFWK